MQSLDFQFWWNVLLSVATTGLAIVTWIRKPGEDAAKAVAELREVISSEVSDLKHVQTQLEERIKHMPRQGEVSELAGDMKAMDSKMNALTESNRGQSLALHRIETWLHEMNRKT